MTYDPTIPQGNAPPASQQAAIQTNFVQYADIFDNNHKALNSFNQGNHTGIILQNQTLDPVVGESNIVLYSKTAVSATSPQPQLFLKVPKFLPTSIDPSNIESLPMQLTYNTVNTAGPIYQSFLPGGYILYFGNLTTSIQVNLITITPTPTKILMAIAMPNTILTAPPSPNTSPGISLSTDILTSTTFNVYVGSSARLPSSYSFSWLAIASA